MADNTTDIRAVLFDLDGTLRHNLPNGFETFIDFLAELGVQVTPDQVLAGHRWTHYYWSISPDMPADHAEFDGNRAGFWRRYAERQLFALGIQDKWPSGAQTSLSELAGRISDLFDQRYNPDNHVPEDVVPALIRLREAGYTVGLVSNRTEALDPLVTELGLSALFDFTLSAGQAGAWKPNPAIFQRALELAGCLPQAAVYVGDNYWADVEGARASGLNPVLIDSYGLFADPGCPVIRTLGELEAALAELPAAGTNLDSLASHI